ncbi:MAG: hypothetical protein NVSMB25_13590 [Thermoleophilaceae bacterium]
MMRGTTIALCALALMAAGCGAPRSGAVSETGPCAQVLPLAAKQVRGRGRLVRLKALKRKDVRALIASLAPPPRPPARHGPGHAAAPTQPLPRKACVLVYRGSFPGGPAPGGGRYLILLISVRHPTVLRQVVTDRVPSAVGKRT